MRNADTPIASTATPVGLKTHDALLHVVLLEAEHARISQLATELANRIRRERESRLTNRRRQWIPGMEVADDSADGFFAPRLYTTWGTFDCAAAFLSPDIVIQPPTNLLAEAGQHVFMGLLPAKPAGLTGHDFNDRFIQEYSKPTQAGVYLPLGQRFFCLTKLKLNPTIVLPLPVPGTIPTSETDVTASREQLDGALAATWRIVAAWLDAADNTSRSAALALGLGWSEFLVVAHANALPPLLDLVLGLRSAYVTGSEIPGRSGGSHLFATSLSTFGCDSEVLLQAERELDATAMDSTICPGRVVPAAQLLPIARRAAAKAGASLPDNGNASSSTLQAVLRPSFHVYPGHEKTLLTRIGEVAPLEPHLKDDASYIGAGKQDLFCPGIDVTQCGNSTVAVTYLTVLLHWLYRDGCISTSSAVNQGGPPLAARPPCFFDSYTHFGAHVVATSLTHTVPADHTKALPSDLFPSPALRAAVDSAVTPTQSALRRLQVPYESSEAVINLITAFCWAYRREILRDETVELAPLFLCMRARLAHDASWWDQRSLAPRLLAAQPPHEPYIDPEVRTRLEARQRVSDVLLQLPHLINAFSTSFNNRYLTSYVLGDLSDLNLRYRGALHQLLSVANMIVDSLVHRLIGPRACVALIGTTESPQVTVALDTVIVSLPAHALSHPFLLQTIGHEAGHRLLLELIDSLRPSSWPHHRWRRPNDDNAHETLVTSLARLQNEVFIGSIARHDVFVESTSDFIEFHALSPDADLHNWARGYLLRAVLVTRPIDQDMYSERAPQDRSEAWVPLPDSVMLRSAVERCIYVTIADELTRWDPSSEGFTDFLRRVCTVQLEELRILLLTNCVLGPMTQVEALVTDKVEWELCINDRVLVQPWLLDQNAARCASQFFRALKGHVHRENTPAMDAGAAGLWRHIQRELVQYRDALLEVALPSIHLRHWIEPNVDTQSRQCWAFPQPLTVARDVNSIVHGGPGVMPRFRSLIVQRGAVVPLDDATQRALAQANRDFYQRLTALIPAWHMATMRTIETVQAS